ncbi:12700_t:CDS:1, partial [Entrophospora sp. SA101]
LSTCSDVEVANKAVLWWVFVQLREYTDEKNPKNLQKSSRRRNPDA